MTRKSELPSREQASRRPDPNPADIRAQMDCVLESAELAGSSRRRALLRFLVEEALAGRSQQLKGFTIGMAVFARDETFDANADPVVRLEAGRLRRSLDSYYADEGRQDALRITIPKGAYQPHFEWQGPGPVADLPASDAALPSSQSAVPEVEEDASGSDVAEVADRAVRKPRWLWPGAALVASALLVILGGIWIWLGDKGETVADLRGPAVIVLPFEVRGGGEETSLIAAGVAQELITDLMRFPDFRLYSASTSFAQDAAAEPGDLGRDLGVAFVVRGSVQSTAGKLRFGSQLVDAKTGEILWSGSYDRLLSPGDILDVQSAIAVAVATALGEPYGVVGGAMARRIAREGAPDMASYACILRAYEFRRSFSDALFAPALACLTSAVVRDPDYADAWAMLGWLHLDAARQDMVPESEHAAQMEAAFQAASHAVALDPASQRGLEALSAITFTNGDFAEAERLQRAALALNPHDPDILAQLGWRLAVRGDWEGGLPYLHQAIARSASPPGWYFHLISVHDYLTGDYAAALSTAERSAKVGSAVGLSLAAISNAKLGNMETARENLVQMAKAWPLLARDPAAAYHNFQADERIVATLVEGLRAAGWTAPDPMPN